MKAQTAKKIAIITNIIGLGLEALLFANKSEARTENSRAPIQRQQATITQNYAPQTNQVKQVETHVEGDYTLKITPKKIISPTSEILQRSSTKNLEETISKSTIDSDALKTAIAHQESNKKLNAKNKYSGASGEYQYMPATALGLIKEAKSKDIEVPYNGRITEADISYALRTDKRLNEWLIDYDLKEKIKMFDGNPGLIGMSHYTNPYDLQASLKKVYPNLKDYSQINIKEFAKKRAKMGCNWLTRPQKNNHPSILKYGLEVTNKYERLAKN